MYYLRTLYDVHCTLNLLCNHAIFMVCDGYCAYCKYIVFINADFKIAHLALPLYTVQCAVHVYSGTCTMYIV